MMDIVYIVPWVEIESGERPEGYKVFIDKEDCIRETILDSRRGVHKTSYCGPKRPLRYYEIEWEVLEENIRQDLRRQVNEIKEIEYYFSFSSNYWKPDLKSNYITM